VARLFEKGNPFTVPCLPKNSSESWIMCQGTTLVVPQMQQINSGLWHLRLRCFCWKFMFFKALEIAGNP
jgi:hypothetical protein